VLDSLKTLAIRLRPLRHLAVLLAVACLAVLAYIVLAGSASGAENRFLVPAIVGLVWGLSAYGFVDTFQTAPPRAAADDGWFARTGRALVRAWFWLLAAAFLVSTLAALFLTFKLGSVWLDKYHGG